MTLDVENILGKVKSGFETLDLPEKYRDAALGWLKTWLAEDDFKVYVPQIKYLIDMEKWDLLLDSFYQVIPFGTGGRRGPVGIGPNRINIWTIRASAQGHSQYLIRQYGDKAGKRGIVLAFDVRNYTQKGVYDDGLPNPVMNLDCRKLASAAAEVYGANGIKVFIFDGPRSTPELSFAIRHLNAVSGVVFSASHNPPTDNGKKIYDEFGGQLIPPHDQILVNEVTENVDEIKTADFDSLVKNEMVKTIGADVDNAYAEAVCALSLSSERDIRVMYSPLHGTGKTSIWPVLKKLGFDVQLDPLTSNLSGAFENVTFNIPNPEVVESFGTSFGPADETGADLILNSDPDADRIGVMVKHGGSWEFLNGNEIGILLANYAIGKYLEKGDIDENSVIVKTLVTTSLIENLALKNGIRCISDLLVGFKYIGEEMNILENKNMIDRFIFGLEESHGYIMGNYCRDKDSAGAGIWICELAAELKKEGKTLLDGLEDIYSDYGYCHNYLTEIRLLGAKGKEQIDEIINHLRDAKIEKMGEFAVTERVDRWDGEPNPHLSATDTSSRNVLIFDFKDIPGIQGAKVTARPSGTEPKLKLYFEVFGNPFDLANIDGEKKSIAEIREKLEQSFMKYCYEVIGVDFPDRGFLLFWQLPLYDKLKYFEVEEEIAALKDIPDREVRKEKLFGLLGFLGADPVEKVDKAFRKKYGKSILDFLETE